MASNKKTYPMIGGKSTESYIEHLENALVFACNFETQNTLRKKLAKERAKVASKGA